MRTDGTSDEETLSNSKVLLVLAFLATRPGYTARRSEVAELLWPDSDRSRGLRALRQALFFLAKHAGDTLERTDETLAIDPEVLDVDLWTFERAAAEEDHRAAIEIYGGPFAAGVERKVGSEAEHWIEALNARIAIALEVAYVREIGDASSQGAAGRAIALARAFAGLNPLDEDRQRLLAKTLAEHGDPLGAVQALEEFRQVTVVALGDTPSPELDARLNALRDELLRAKPGSPRGPVPVPAEPVPQPERRRSAPFFTVRGRPVGRALAVGGAGALLLAASVTALGVVRAGHPSPPPLPGLDARILALAQHGNQSRVLELALGNPDVMAVERPDLRDSDVLSPDGRTIATTLQASDGWNLAIRRPGADPRVLTTGPGDEVPIGWSPDGRYLVYAHRRLLADGRTQSHRLEVYDLAADSAWRLSSLESAERPSAAWSPGGTRIAFTADVRGAPDVFVADFNGANLHDLTRHPAWDGDPAWAAAGDRLAFISRRAGGAELYSVRHDGSDLQRLTQSEDDERHPLWLSPTTLAVLVGDDDDRAVGVVDTYTGQRHLLGGPAGLVRLLARAGPPPPWLERLTITPRLRAATPGQRLALRVLATASNGDTLDRPLVLDWSVTDPTVIRLDAPGQLSVVGIGRAAVIANAAGWRADTLIVYALPLAERAVAAAFVETWRRGLDPERWRVFGDPTPVTRDAGGPDSSGVFANSGDAFFESGAVTREAFPLRDGLGVELDGRMPFTNKLHQEFGVALYDAEHPDSTLASGTAPALVELRVRGPGASDSVEAWIATPEWREAIPAPPDPDHWHRYTLQVLADGWLELLVDGRMLWRSAAPVTRRGGAVRVGLGFRSFETEILHGRLRVFTPPRYYLPRVALDGDTAVAPAPGLGERR